MPAPGIPFSVYNVASPGILGIETGPGILEHLSVNNISGAFLWVQVFDAPAVVVNGAIPLFVFPLPASANLFWTPPTPATGGAAVIGWRFTQEFSLALSTTPSVLTAAIGFPMQFWVYGRGTE